MSYKVEIIDNKPIKIYKVVCHMITMGDVDDPDIYLASPIYDWQQTEKGKWIMSHSYKQPIYHQMLDQNIFGYRYAISAFLKEKDYTYYCLKWPDNY
ncbi:MAG: hypothetical protein EBT86_13020 [Actinobacteria bacterium]|nr:hypothetical protein [Actinomycetota bacterium]